jgi:hypothetical protein
MISSEILQEKDKTQARLSEECTSIHDYFVKSHIAAEKAAETYGFTLRYAEMPNLALQRTPLRSAAELRR